MKLRPALVPAFASLVAALSGCNFTLGDGGAPAQTQFSYVSLDCILGCDVGRAMMTGTHETIAIEGGALVEGFTLDIDDPSVVTGTLVEDPQCCTSTATSNGGSGGCVSIAPGAACNGTLDPGYSANVVAVGPGSATLTLHAADGSVVDSVVLHVADPASLAFSCNITTGSGPQATQTTAVAVPAGEICSFDVQAFDASSTLLQASSGFDITSANPAVAEAQPFFDLMLGPPDAPVTDAQGSVAGEASGTTSLVIQTGGITKTIPVTVP